MQNINTDIFILNPNTILNNRYEIIKTIGFGGFSIIYEAYDKLFNSHVAVKEYFPHYIAERVPYQNNVVTRNHEDSIRFSDGLKDFRDEANRMVKLRGMHNTVNVFGLFEENNTCYIIMELLDGQSLLSYLKSLPDERFTDIEDAKKIIYSVAEALEYTHSQKLLHRDVSPDNIFLCSDGKVKLIDFGAAREITENGELSVVVKSGCTPPEQYRKHGRQGPWTDLYALGATFYRMLTGVYPESAPDRIDSNDEYMPPSAINPFVPAYIDAMILRCLAYNHTLRIAKASEIKSILEKERIVESIQVTRKKKNFVTAATYISFFSCLLLFVIISFIVLKQSETLYSVRINDCEITVELPDNFTTEGGKQALVRDFKNVCPQINIQFGDVDSDLCVYIGDNSKYSKLTEIMKLNESAEEYCVTVAYDSEILYLNTLKMYESSLDINAYSTYGDIPAEYYAESYEMFISPENISFAYVGSVSKYRDVQRDLCGMYKLFAVDSYLIPIQLAVKSDLSDNDKKAAMRFLLYLSSERAQEIMFISNEGFIPAEQSQYNKYFEINSELEFLQ